jgi:Protein of unknown function (DUF1194)
MRRRALLLGSLATLAAAPDAVDVLLILGIDVSRSVTDDEAQLQRDGYRAALTDKQVIAAITGGPVGAIGLAYFEWARFDMQQLILPWTRIAGATDAQAWSQRLSQPPYHSLPRTSISGALTYAGQLFGQAPWSAPRRVIDISGDGANNNGPPTDPVRDQLVAAGITINGLPIINRHPRWGFIEEGVPEFYRDHVVGGPGSFLIVADNFDSFAEAIRKKMVQEIAWR